jgi:hypothetical protein
MGGTMLAADFILKPTDQQVPKRRFFITSLPIITEKKL